MLSQDSRDIMYFGKSSAFCVEYYLYSLCVYSSSQQKLVLSCGYSVYMHIYVCVYVYTYLSVFVNYLKRRTRVFASFYFSNVAMLRIVLGTSS